jgi:apolipoprotein N-acyltransferase
MLNKSLSILSWRFAFPVSFCKEAYFITKKEKKKKKKTFFLWVFYFSFSFSFSFCWKETLEKVH